MVICILSRYHHLAFWMEIVHGLAKTSYVVFDESFGKLANRLASLMGI